MVYLQNCFWHPWCSQSWYIFLESWHNSSDHFYRQCGEWIHHQSWEYLCHILYYWAEKLFLPSVLRNHHILLATAKKILCQRTVHKNGWLKEERVTLQWCGDLYGIIHDRVPQAQGCDTVETKIELYNRLVPEVLCLTHTSKVFMQYIKKVTCYASSKLSVMPMRVLNRLHFQATRKMIYNKLCGRLMAHPL